MRTVFSGELIQLSGYPSRLPGVCSTIWWIS